ncbi:MAG: hypothetical protein JJE22_17135 [Bacteroidia bacterium]|nr:hypothetical protein [Bacteroidia bacterium]
MGLFLFCYANLYAQKEGPSKRLTVFIDCNGVSCDENYIHTEINIVDFLAERAGADVDILITAAPTGGRTDQYQLIFYGQNNFKTHLDTLRFTTETNATKDEMRIQLVHFIKLGLVPLLSKTPTLLHFQFK